VDGNRIKVLYISPVAERGGAETVLLNILKFHDRERFEPIVCMLRPGPLADETRGLGVRTLIVEGGRLRNVVRTLGVVRTVHRLIESEAIDIVFGNMTTGHVVAGLAAIGTHARRAWFQHGTASASDLLDWLAALIPSDRIYVNSRASADAQAKLPRRTRTMQQLAPGIDQTRFSPAPRADRPVLRSLGVQGGHPVVGMIARLQRGKGQDVFIRAAAEIASARPDVRFVLAGDTQFGLEAEFKQQLHDLAVALGVDRAVIFAGFRDDVPSLLNELDVVVHPHRMPEAFGLSVAEAMLMGKAVVASDLGGPAELIADGETGMLIAPDDPPALARAILMLLSNPVRRNQLGRAARESVLNRFTMERMIGDLEASFVDVLN
jgi:glycosyltransferase involved in cell wall biosynthesis